MKHFKVEATSNTHAAKLSTRCPQCHQNVVLETVGQDIAIGPNTQTGQRRCPNPDCLGHLFVIASKGKILVGYPPIRLDFDPADIPEGIVNTFEEALNCHAIGADVAAAIMVRRTLEEICADRQAIGKSLKLRLEDLGKKIVLPKDLIEAMDELRLLGNDAAHIEAREYENVSSVELEVAIAFTKEILKALYQYAALLGRMRSLKKQEGG